MTSTAKLVIREALPIQCVEAVFVGAYLTAGMKEARLNQKKIKLVPGSLDYPFICCIYASFVKVFVHQKLKVFGENSRFLAKNSRFLVTRLLKKKGKIRKVPVTWYSYQFVCYTYTYIYIYVRKLSRFFCSK